MFKELLQSLNNNLKITESKDDWISSDKEIYEVEISYREEDKQLVKLIISKLMLKEFPFEDLNMTGYHTIRISVELGNEGILYKAFEEVVGEIKSEGKSMDEIFERIDELSPDECKILYKKIMSVLF